MAIKKSELYSTLWKSCDELRGGMDASQYKDYVLVLLFMKYVSDKAASQSGYLLDVPPGARFADMVALKGKPDIGEEINKIIARLAEANELAGVIDVADFNDPEKLGRGQEMVDRLSNLIAIFDKPELDFRDNRAEGDDLLGDAYEFLMRHFATESGKSKGQFYTPAEVSRIMAKVLGVREAREGTQTIYDPACGSGSLLLKVHDEAQAATGLDLAIYGQEMDVATTALAKMNMILHDALTADIASGGYSTLATPQFTAGENALKTFDFVVANPPFSNKAWRNGFKPEADKFGRFAAPYTVPPAKNGDFAFLLHIIASLKSTGKAAVILPHGVLFRGNAEAQIRREIVRRGYIKGIIGLPPNLFYGTGIPACIVVLDKAEAATRKGIFMIDASRGLMKDGPKNRLRAQDIHRIVDAFAKQVDVPRYARVVPLDEIADPKNDFNLNLPRYIDSAEPEDLQDIDGHLRGGIPERDLDAFDAYWAVLTGVRAALFEAGGRPGYERLRLPLSEVKPAIFGHAEFVAFHEKATRVFADWCKRTAPRLTDFDQNGHPKALIETIAEDLMGSFRQAPLLDPYDVYQHLMNYWAETMQDDTYLIAADGWVKGARPREIIQVKNKDTKLVWPEPHDYMLGKRRFKSDLVPATILVARYFAAERDAIEALDDQIATLEQQLDVMREEDGGEEGLLADANEATESEPPKISAKSVRTALKNLGDDPDDAEAVKALETYSSLLEQQSAAKAKHKAAQEDLDQKIDSKYSRLTEAEIKTLVVDDKWVARLSAAVQGELDRVSRTLTGRIRQLAERYATPLPELTEEVEMVARRVDAHLKAMGASWN